MVTPVPLPVIVLPNVPVCEPLFQPVKVPSSKPVLEIAAALTDVTGGITSAISAAGTRIHAPLLIILLNAFCSLPRTDRAFRTLFLAIRSFPQKVRVQRLAMR